VPKFGQSRRAQHSSKGAPQMKLFGDAVFAVDVKGGKRKRREETARLITSLFLIGVGLNFETVISSQRLLPKIPPSGHELHYYRDNIFSDWLSSRR